MLTNQRVSAPFGDITLFNTPKTDAFIQNHQQQERQDELMRNKELQDMDKQLSSHIGNVLNPDIPEIVGKWQDYTDSKKNLLFNKKLQNDPAAYAQASIDSHKKLADALGSINESAQRKAALNGQAQNYYKNPHQMEDNFYDRLNMSLNTPTSYAKQHPEFDNHYWQGPNMDFTKSVNDAAGKSRVLKTDYKPVGSNGEQVIPVQISGKNTPEEFLNALNQKVNDRSYASNASKAYQNMTPEEVQQINAHYAALPAEKFSGWGYKEKPNLDPANPNNPVDQFNSLQAKSYAINHQFESKDGKPEISSEIRRNQNELSKLRVQRDAIWQRAAASKSVASFKKSLGIAEDATSEDGDPIEPVFNKLEENAKEGGLAPYIRSNGQTIPAYTVKAPLELKKALAVKDGPTIKYPDEVKFTADGKDYMGIFYKKDPKNNLNQ